MLGWRRKPGSWQHACAAGRTVLERSTYDRLEEALSTPASRQALRRVFTFLGGVIEDDDGQRRHLELEEDVQMDALFPIPASYNASCLGTNINVKVFLKSAPKLTIARDFFSLLGYFGGPQGA